MVLLARLFCVVGVFAFCPTVRFFCVVGVFAFRPLSGVRGHCSSRYHAGLQDLKQPKMTKRAQKHRSQVFTLGTGFCDHRGRKTNLLVDFIKPSIYVVGVKSSKRFNANHPCGVTRPALIEETWEWRIWVPFWWEKQNSSIYEPPVADR